MGSGGSGKGSRGRGRRRPRGGGGGGGGPRSGGQRAPVMHAPRKGKAFSTPYTVPETGPIDPFDLFCACFIGLMPDGSYRGGGLGEAAKHLRRSPNELRQMLQDYGMDPETLKQMDFDLSLAKLDIQVAPEGIDRRELARGLFEEFCDLHPTLTGAPMPAAGGNGARPAEAPESAQETKAPAPEAKRAAPEAERAAEPVSEAPAEEAVQDATEDAAQGPVKEPAKEVAEDVSEDASQRTSEEASEDASESASDETMEDEEEESLAAVDAGVTRGAPAQGERSGRPVRQIRRSPTRRGR
jgi:hypothetical protein